MPVTEQLMGLGEWSLRFKADAPHRVKEAAWHPHSLVMVTNGRANPDIVGDAGMRALARYSGVLLARTDTELSGAGIAWHLGDRDDQGPRYNGVWSADTYATVYSELITLDLYDGSYPSGGSVSAVHTYSSPTRRKVLDEITSAHGHEWRANGDLTVDVNTPTVLYGVATVLLTPGGGRRGGVADEPLLSLDARFETSVDWEQVYEIVQVVGQSSLGVSSGVSAYDNPRGGSKLRPVYIHSPDLPGTVFPDLVAAALAPGYQNEAGRLAVTVTDIQERVEQAVNVGDNIYVYDPANGVYDLGIYVTFDGQRIFPRQMRVARLTWPVVEGMGVYSRVRFDGDPAPTYTDLSPYIEFEAPGSTLEVVENGDVARFTGESKAGRVDPVTSAILRAQNEVWETYTPSWTSSGTAPSLGNGTIVGGYRAVGTTLHLRGELVVGSTSTVGTGHLRVSLPLGVTAVAAQAQSCSARWYDASAGFVYSATGIAEAGLGYVTFVVSGRSEDRFPSSALANGDYVTWGGTIERTGS